MPANAIVAIRKLIAATAAARELSSIWYFLATSKVLQLVCQKNERRRTV